MHLGEEPRFELTIVNTYSSTFSRAMGKVIRILYILYVQEERRKGSSILLRQETLQVTPYSAYQFRTGTASAPP